MSSSADFFLARRGTSVPGVRRVLTHDEALALAKFALGVTSKFYAGVAVVSLTHQVTTTATVLPDGRVRSHTSDDFKFDFATSVGNGVQLTVDADVRDTAALQRVIEHANMRAVPSPRPEDLSPELRNLDSMTRKFFGPHQYPSCTLWRDSTADALDLMPGQILPGLVQQVKNANLSSAATMAVTGRAVLAYSSYGLSAWAELTDSEISVTARALDGTGSGWSGHCHRDWTKLQTERVVHEAIDMALRNRGAVRFEPGRYTAILSPTAVGQLMKQNAMAFDVGKGAPFILTMPRRDGRTTRITEQVADPRITMWTDPSDTENGIVPFFGDGYPSGKTTWIEKGVLKALAFNPGEAAKRLVPPAKFPFGLQMTGGTTTIDEMIASCERGIYVNRFSDIHTSDYPSATMTGVTRDGCFLIKDRKIHKPITNFRFYESPLLILTKILALGPPQRASFGFSPTKETLWNTFDPWPYEPVVTPALMVQDFNFSALSDAV